MTNPTDTVTGIQHRKPRAGERTRGSVDAMQTKFAVGVQNLDPSTYLDQLQANIDELPDAAGADAAFIALIGEDGGDIETVLASNKGFARCKPEQLAGEKLEDWQWLRSRLGHLRVVEVADTMPERIAHRLGPDHRFLGARRDRGFSRDRQRTPGGRLGGEPAPADEAVRLIHGVGS